MSSHSKRWGNHPAVPTGDDLTLGERAADAIAAGLGSWPFLLGQTAFILLWVASNIVLWNLIGWTYDAYPYIFLNFLFSFQAAYAAPILQMAANRKDAINAALAQHDREQAAEIHRLVKELHEARKGTATTTDSENDH